MSLWSSAGGSEALGGPPPPPPDLWHRVARRDGFAERPRGDAHGPLSERVLQLHVERGADVAGRLHRRPALLRERDPADPGVVRMLSSPHVAERLELLDGLRDGLRGDAEVRRDLAHRPRA